MARNFCLVSLTIWNSRKFTNLASDDAKLLYFYLLTCPSSNSIGCYVLKPGYAAADLGWSAERYRKGIDTLCMHSMIGIDAAENVVRIEGFLKQSGIMSPKHGIGAVKLALELPDCEQKLTIIKELAAHENVNFPDLLSEIAKASERVSEGYAKGMHIQKQIPIQKQIEEERGKPLSCEPDETENRCIEHFNATAGRVGWPQVQKVTTKRRSKLRQRLSDCGGQDAWCEAITRAALSPLLTGQGNRDWRASFDWLAEPANFTKLMEGNYDPRPTNGNHASKPASPHEAMVRAFAAVALEHQDGRGFDD